MITKKSRGSILQITLVVLSVLTVCIMALATKTKLYGTSYQEIKDVNNLRNIENITVGYILYSNYNDELFSELVEGENYEVYYTVDDMASTWFVDCTIEYKESKRRFCFDLVKDTNVIENFQYN